jgi:hypothetical protein
MNWVARVGGTSLESDQEHMRIPLLYSLHQSNQWETQCLVDSLIASETITRAAKPRKRITGANPSQVKTGYGDPLGREEVPPGYDVEDVPPDPIDTALLEIAQRIQNQTSKSTVSAILQNGDFPSGTAFATLNLATQTAVGVLYPYKELAEYSIADTLRHMLLHIHYGGEDVEVYSEDGKMSISPEDIVPESLYITVELDEKLPSDQQQRINASAIAVQQLGMSQETALGDIGVADPAREMRKALREQLMQNELALEIQKKQMELQMRAQQMQTKMQMMAQQAQQQQPMPGQPPGMMGVSGPGYDPAVGGRPPAEANPAATREGQTGQSFTGEEIA